MTPTLRSAMNALIQSHIADVRVCVVATVVAYDAAEQRCSVSPVVRARYETEDGEVDYDEKIVIGNVPVVFPGSGDYGITFPIAVGDTVTVLFSEESLDTWLRTGNDDIKSNDMRRNDISDAIAIPGIRPFKTPTSQVDATATVVRGDIKLGSKDASESACKAESLASALSTLHNAMGVYFSALGTATATGPGAATVNAAITSFGAAVYGATKVKVE